MGAWAEAGCGGAGARSADEGEDVPMSRRTTRAWSQRSRRRDAGGMFVALLMFWERCRAVKENFQIAVKNGEWCIEVDAGWCKRLVSLSRGSMSHAWRSG